MTAITGDRCGQHFHCDSSGNHLTVGVGPDSTRAGGIDHQEHDMRAKQERMINHACEAVIAHARELLTATMHRRQELLATIATVAGHAAWNPGMPAVPQQIGPGAPLRIQADRGDREGDL